MTELVLLGAYLVLGVALLLIWMKSPWRSLLAWIFFLSVQLNYKLVFSEFRPALSDLFVPSMVLGLWLMRSRAAASKKRSLLPTFIVLFATLFLTVGNIVAYLELRTIPQWTWLNKDIGLLDLTFSFFAILHLVDTREKLNEVVKVFVLSGSAINVVALLGGIARYVFEIQNMMMRESGSLRLTGFMVNPSSYGGFIFCVLLMQFALLLGGSKLLPLSTSVQRLNLALLGIAAILTLSRSTLLGLVAGMLALLMFYRIKAGLQLAALALACLAGLTIVVYWYAPPTTSTQALGIELSQHTILERIDANRIAFNMLVDGLPLSVVSGIGVGTFLMRSEGYLGLPLIIHNDFLWLLVETGLWGFLLFALIVGRSLQNCYRVARARVAESPIAVGVACAIVATLGWMQGTEGFWHRHVWFLLALSEVCYRLHRKQRAAFLPSDLGVLRPERVLGSPEACLLTTPKGHGETRRSDMDSAAPTG